MLPIKISVVIKQKVINEIIRKLIILQNRKKEQIQNIKNNGKYNALNSINISKVIKNNLQLNLSE